MSDAAMISEEATKLQIPSEIEMRAVLEQHNPEAPLDEVRSFAEIIVYVSDVLAELPESERRKLARSKDRVREVLFEAAGPDGERVGRQSGSEDSEQVEKSRGSGLGQRVAADVGRGYLDRYAEARPLESWAGPVAGAVEIEKQLGVPRSTLSNWQRRGAVVGLLRGERKLAYPLEQFVDARPLEGMSEILKVARDARAAWLWLRQPHGALKNQPPLAVLRAGGRDRVVRVAERDFD